MVKSRLCSRRTSTIFVSLLALFLLGTVIVLSTVNAYFSIDNSAYILPGELGNWDEIRWNPKDAGLDDPIAYSWAKNHPAIAKYFFPSKLQNANAEASTADALAAPQSSKLPSRPTVSAPWTVNDPPELIPRIIHQTWKTDQLPSRWQAVKDECTAMHPDYKYMLWTDDTSRAFIAEHYAWFLDAFDGYPYPIQRADAIRYFVLHHYGGIYMDLDIGCIRPLDPLLRFEVILPRTIPVGVSNDLIFAAKEHPFMTQVIHGLVTFNHRYLTNYPTVMFSTGPMFLSASYGLFVQSHGAAMPSTSAYPEAGFKGVRVLPKSLYGKNAKPGEAPDAFFRHYYGSSWHSNDAGFLIFLRDHGRLLMFVGACVVAYFFVRAMLPRILRVYGPEAPISARRNSRPSGRWISLAVRDPDLDRSRTSTRSNSTRKGLRNSSRSTMDDFGVASTSSTSREAVSAAAASKHVSMAAPRPQRLNLPLFELQDGQDEAACDETESSQSLMAWMGSTLSRSSSRNEGPGKADEGEKKKKDRGVLYLPAYFVNSASRHGEADEDASTSTSGLLSPSSSPSTTTSGSAPGWIGHSRSSSTAGPANGLGTWAASLLPAGWRTPSPVPGYLGMLLSGRTPSPAGDIDLESVCSSPEPSNASHSRRPSTAARFADMWITPSDSPVQALSRHANTATPPPAANTSLAYSHAASQYGIDAPPFRMPAKGRRNASDSEDVGMYGTHSFASALEKTSESALEGNEEGESTAGPGSSNDRTIRNERPAIIKSPSMHRAGSTAAMLVGAGAGTGSGSDASTPTGPPPTLRSASQLLKRQTSASNLNATGAAGAVRAVGIPDEEDLIDPGAAPPPYEPASDEKR